MTILALLGVGWILVTVTHFAAEIISAPKTRANERRAINDFCKRHNYCEYGCGGGHNHNPESYYGEWNCGSDHK